MSNTNDFIITLILRYKRFLVWGIVLVVFLFIAIFFFNPNPLTPGGNPLSSYAPSPVKPSILNTYPSNNMQNVPAGEIEIILTFNTQISDKNSIKLSFTPPLPYYYKIIDSAPSNTVRARIYGGLQTNTKYTVRAERNTGVLYTWDFTTSSRPGESSSSLTVDEDQKIIGQYYPLAKYLPYETVDFYIEYQARLTLKVVVKTQDQVTVEQEVFKWVRSRGVNPATHTINYILQ